ncbi:MAG: hypothetical protein KDD69_01445 [Bdellovibrionales bacterium]|nr:hypothetical protein [Bdellovibrionales bacterium]
MRRGLTSSTSTRFISRAELIAMHDHATSEHTPPSRTPDELYRQLLLPRCIEERMLVLLRQGRISKWFSGIGQEAMSVGATLALRPDEFIFTVHRNLGVFTSRQVPLVRLFAQLTGKADGYSQGRERSFHFGTLEHRIIGMISHLAAQLPLADGVGLAHRLSGDRSVVLAFCGEGATSQGDFHEALNLAAVWSLPVIFLIENNGYALSTPVQEQYRCGQLADRAAGYGMEGRVIDGNDVLEVHRVVTEVAQSIRENPRPVLLECMSFRVRGHEEASGVKYVPPELIESWKAKDPLHLLEQELGISEEQKVTRRQALEQEISTALEQALDLPEPASDEAREVAAVYHPLPQEVAPSGSATERRFVDAISDGLHEAMRRHPQLILMGQDIAEYGGVFKVTEGFLSEFGPQRVRNTPLCESAVLGAGQGMSLLGYKSVVEMQFADFVSCGFNQIVNNIAKAKYRWNAPADVVVRLPCGGGTQAGPFHSQSNEAWFLKTPGLMVFYPATATDAKGLLLAAIETENPVLFFEHKLLYRRVREPVPDGYYRTLPGQAVVRREGKQVSIITWGLGVHWAEELANRRPDVSIEIVDLRTLCPLDFATVAASVEKTARALILHEDSLCCGFGAELVAQITEHCFHALDAPVVRVGSLDTPIPFAAALEAAYLANARLEKTLDRLLRY